MITLFILPFSLICVPSYGTETFKKEENPRFQAAACYFAFHSLRSTET